MSFSDKLKNDLDINKDFNSSQSSDWFKFKEGDNIFRILSEPIIFFEKFKTGICYTDCGYQGTAKYLTWILDRADGKIKLAKIPYSLAETLGAYEKDEDYKFEGFPMPYDVKINAKGAGTKEVAYTILPKPRTELSAEIMTEVEKKNKPEAIIEKMKEKQKEKHVADGTWQKEQDRKAELKQTLADAKQGKGEGLAEAGIEYPHEEINPDDIPF